MQTIPAQSELPYFPLTCGRAPSPGKDMPTKPGPDKPEKPPKKKKK